MGRIIWIYGCIAGIVLASSFAIGYWMGAEIDDHNVFVGYSIMLIALSMIFVGVKQYRDKILGGVIRFWPAFGVGMGIAAVASLFYVIGWEIYMYATDYSFMGAYVESTIAANCQVHRRDEGVRDPICQPLFPHGNDLDRNSTGWLAGCIDRRRRAAQKQLHAGQGSSLTQGGLRLNLFRCKPLAQSPRASEGEPNARTNNPVDHPWRPDHPDIHCSQCLSGAEGRSDLCHLDSSSGYLDGDPADVAGRDNP